MDDNLVKECNSRQDFEALLSPIELNQAKSEIAKSLFVKSINHGQDKFGAAAAAVAIALGWRWSGVSRYVPGMNEVEVLAWWDDDRLRSTFSYDLAGTPCEQILCDATKDYVSFLNVKPRFPKELALRSMDVECYAGYTYCNSKGELLGHVFAMDNVRQDPQYPAYDVLYPITTTLSREIGIA